MVALLSKGKDKVLPGSTQQQHPSLYTALTESSGEQSAPILMTRGTRPTFFGGAGVPFFNLPNIENFLLTRSAVQRF